MLSIARNIEDNIIEDNYHRKDNIIDKFFFLTLSCNHEQKRHTIINYIERNRSVLIIRTTIKTIF